MKRRTFVASVAASGASLALAESGLAQTDAGTATPATEGDDERNQRRRPATPRSMTSRCTTRSTAVAACRLCCSRAPTCRPARWSFSCHGLAKTRQVIATDFQGHGRTADVDRPLTYEQMADDVAGLMEHLGIAQADIVGYSMGGATGLRLAIDRPELVRKLVAISAHFRLDSIYPEVLAGIAEVTPEIMMGTPWYEEYYAPVAPRPEDFPILVEKLKELDATEFDWSQEIDAIAAPTLLIYGDADVIQPEPMVELFRLLGGGVPGDLTGLPKARLAILPSTTHVGVMNRADWLLPMITEFLDEPMPEEG